MRSTKSAYWDGFKAGAPFILVIVPFGMLFGVVGTEAGLSLPEVMGFTILVIAGAAQFTAVQLMTDHAPTIIILASALAVNLRMAMYSASIAPHLGRLPIWKRAVAAYFMVDQTYAVSAQEYENYPEMTLDQRFAYFIGSVSPICPLWYVSTYAGVVVGQAIPPEYGLDFAIPITFIALIAPALRSLPHLIAAAVSVTGALALAWIPFNLGLLLAAAIAMIAGAQAEIWIKGAKA